jgi:hypothetical protein
MSDYLVKEPSANQAATSTFDKFYERKVSQDKINQLEIDNLAL